MRGIWIGWLLASAIAYGADQTPSELLTRIRAQMTQTLARLPDYTCRETIQRSVKDNASSPLEERDLIRVEVAYLGGRELYAWPGSSAFGSQGLAEMIPGGSIGTGNFGALSRDVFTTQAATFIFKGRSTVNGRHEARFDFTVPAAKSRYVIRYAKAAAIVPYQGWFTADTDTYDVIDFEVDADDIPEKLETRRGEEHVQYVRLRIAGGDYLLPQTSDTLLADPSGGMSRNHITIEGCREYSGQATVKFTDPDLPAVAPSAGLTRELPPGVQLEIRLDTPIRRGVTAIGDVVSGEVLRAVRRPVMIPKGAKAALRVTRMEIADSRRARAQVLSFALLNVQAGGVEYDVKAAELESASGIARYQVAPGGVLAFWGSSFQIQPGLRMLWRVRKPPKANP